MATPTTLPSTFVASQVLTAAQMNNLRGAFRILQVVSTAKTDTFTTTSTTFTDITGYSVTITPSSTSSQVLIVATLNVAGLGGTNAYFGRLLRGSTAIAVGDLAGSRIQATISGTAPDGNTTECQTVMFLDSPATTSATTYKMQIASNVAAATVAVNRGVTDTNSNQVARMFSSITVFEVSA
jgi:hypothetical protein